MTSRIRLEDEGRIGIGVLYKLQMLSLMQQRVAKAIVHCFVISTTLKSAIFIREGADVSFKVSLRNRGSIAGTFARIALKLIRRRWAWKSGRIHGMAAPSAVIREAKEMPQLQS